MDPYLYGNISSANVRIFNLARVWDYDELYYYRG